MSAGEKVVKAVWPFSKALMTWLRRGRSAMEVPWDGGFGARDWRMFLSANRHPLRWNMRARRTPYCDFRPAQRGFLAGGARTAPLIWVGGVPPSRTLRQSGPPTRHRARRHDHRLSRPLHDRAAEAA